MALKRLSGPLRIAMAIGLLLTVVAAGWLQRPPLILPMLALAFTAAFLAGQIRTWRVARRTGRIKAYFLQLPADYFVQLALVTVIYLIGLGLKGLLASEVALAPASRLDALLPLAAGAAGVGLGFLIDWLEGRPDSLVPDWMIGPEDDDGATGRILVGTDPVTAVSFFGAEETQPASEQAITDAEARLGRELPPLLKDLYRHRNGGRVSEMCIPRPGIDAPERFDQVILPFGPYQEIVPVDFLLTLEDAMRVPGDPDEGTAPPPEGAANMLVLAQCFGETLFLDYNRSGPPRVGFADFTRFDLSGRRDAGDWWPDFSAFFQQLRHYDPA